MVCINSESCAAMLQMGSWIKCPACTNTISYHYAVQSATEYIWAEDRGRGDAKLTGYNLG